MARRSERRSPIDGRVVKKPQVREQRTRRRDADNQGSARNGSTYVAWKPEPGELRHGGLPLLRVGAFPPAFDGWKHKVRQPKKTECEQSPFCDARARVSRREPRMPSSQN